MTQNYIVIILKVARLFLVPDYYIMEIVLSSISEMWNSKGIWELEPSYPTIADIQVQSFWYQQILF